MSDLSENRVLFVDDDSSLLQAVTRQFHGKFLITTAVGGRDGEQKLTTAGPFAVIVSDMRMPDMNGIQFLSRARDHAPDAVRIMLTGNADLETAMHAVNEGNIYRFLLKPCRREVLEWALEAALEQHRLVTSERVLLEKTLKGSVQVLIDILSLVNPVAFSRASRVRDYVTQLCRRLNVSHAWQIEIAALLSQIGCIAVPHDILTSVVGNAVLSEEEARIYHSHPGIGGKLIGQIPRLEIVSQIIAGQETTWNNAKQLAEAIARDRGVLGAHLLKVCLDFDALMCQGKSRRQAIDTLKSHRNEYYPIVLEALEVIEVTEHDVEELEVSIKDLTDNAILAQEVRTKGGLLVAPKGQKVSLSLRVLLENYATRGEIDRRVRISVQQVTQDQKPQAVH